MGEWLLGGIDRATSAVAYREIGSIMVKITRGMVGSEDAMIGMRRRTQKYGRSQDKRDKRGQRWRSRRLGGS